MSGTTIIAQNFTSLRIIFALKLEMKKFKKKTFTGFCVILVDTICSAIPVPIFMVNTIDY